MYAHINPFRASPLIAAFTIFALACKDEKPPLPSANITSFNLELDANGNLRQDVLGVIDESSRRITLTLPYSADLATLRPTIAIRGKSVSPESGAPNDFTNPAAYTVTAEDGITQRVYTVTAQKHPQENYVILFDSQGGSDVPDQPVKEGELLNPVPVPTRPNKTFAGWFLDQGTSNRFDPTKPILDPLSLYARWEDGLEAIVANGKIPLSLSGYDALTRATLANCKPDAKVTAYYVTKNGAGAQDGSSWGNASLSLKSGLDLPPLPDADNVRLILVGGGEYAEQNAMALKNYVVVIGGWAASGGWTRPPDSRTLLSGNKTHRVFDNPQGVDRTATLCAVTIMQGDAQAGNGGGMLNKSASPTLIGVIFSENSALNGAALHNETPNVNTAYEASPILIGVTFRDNNASGNGGAMYSLRAFPTLVSATFSGNKANSGGAIYSTQSRLVVIGSTFSGNMASGKGNALYLNNDKTQFRAPQETEALIVNSILWGNGSKPIYIDATGGADECLTIYHSVVQGGLGQTMSGAYQPVAVERGAIEAEGSPTNNNVQIIFNEVTDADPGLSALAIGGWSYTFPIGAASPAVDRALHIRQSYEQSGSNLVYTLYYSVRGIEWHTTLDPQGLGTLKTLPSIPTPENLTEMDGRGYQRHGSPDIGSHEAGAYQY